MTTAQRWSMLIAGLATSAGFVYFLVHTNILIIAPYHSSYTPALVTAATKKNSTLFFYKQDAWRQEVVPLLLPDQQAEALSCVANRWLVLATEEELMTKKVRVEHAFITQDGIGYLSCDQCLFESAQSTREKFFLIQGLIRSIKAAGISLKGVYFLVQNKPMADYHLDFSVPWSCEPYNVNN